MCFGEQSLFLMQLIRPYFNGGYFKTARVDNFKKKKKRISANENDYDFVIIEDPSINNIDTVNDTTDTVFVDSAGPRCADNANAETSENNLALSTTKMWTVLTLYYYVRKEKEGSVNRKIIRNSTRYLSKVKSYLEYRLKMNKREMDERITKV